jgi:hypothetical protein
MGAEPENGRKEPKVSNTIVASQFLPTVLQQNKAARLTLTLGPCIQMTTTATLAQRLWPLSKPRRKNKDSKTT